MKSNISEEAYEAALELVRSASNAPSTREIAAYMETFALMFGKEVGIRLLNGKLNDDTLLAVRNAVDRAAKGEP